MIRFEKRIKLVYDVFINLKENFALYKLLSLIYYW